MSNPLPSSTFLTIAKVGVAWFVFRAEPDGADKIASRPCRSRVEAQKLAAKISAQTGEEVR